MEKICKHCKHFRYRTSHAYDYVYNNSFLLKESRLDPLPPLPNPPLKAGDLMTHTQGCHVGENYSCNEYEKMC